MYYFNVENPTWNREGTMIDCFVTFERLGRVPFTASPNDLPHSVEIYQRCLAGEFGPIADYVPQPDEGPQESTPLELLPDFMRIPVTNTENNNNTDEVL